MMTSVKLFLHSEPAGDFAMVISITSGWATRTYFECDGSDTREVLRKDLTANAIKSFDEAQL